MFYRLNLPRWERALRIVAGLAVGASALAGWGWSLTGALGLAAGAGALATGWIGFCPACALFGRRRVEASR